MPLKNEINKEVLLKSKPIKNPNVKSVIENGEVKITLERKKTLWVGFLSKLFIMPKSRIVVLDKVGSDVWNLFDGKRRVIDIVNFLVKTHKLTPYEAEVSLITYLKMLMKKGIIGMEVNKKYIDK